jgi:hypothetical protein
MLHSTVLSADSCKKDQFKKINNEKLKKKIKNLFLTNLNYEKMRKLYAMME